METAAAIAGQGRSDRPASTQDEDGACRARNERHGQRRPQDRMKKNTSSATVITSGLKSASVMLTAMNSPVSDFSTMAEKSTKA